MAYKRRVGQEYRPIRRRTTSGKAGPLKSRVISSPPTQGFPSSSHRFYANIMDLTRFLAKYLSGKDNIIVSTSKSKTAGYAISRDIVKGKTFYHVRVPDWQTYDLPVGGFDKYRIYRSGLWHESSHARYTPEQIYTHGDKISHDVINIIEDRRIEDLGVEEWRGYLPERIYTNAYGYALRPDVGDEWNNLQLWSRGNPRLEDVARIRHEAFMQKMIVGKIKGEDKLPQPEKDKIESAVAGVEKELEKAKKFKDDHKKVYDLMADLTEKVIGDLELRKRTVSEFQPQPEGQSSWDDTFTEEYAEKAKPQQVKEDMKEYFDKVKKEAEKPEPSDEPISEKEPGEITERDVEEAIRGSEQVSKEYEQAAKEEVDQLTPMFNPVASAVSPDIYRDQKFITRMDAALRGWKVGRREFVGETGARLSIPHYIRYKEEPFVTRIKMSARGRKILVVTDFSGSMHSRQEEYKKALISSMEVLDGIGSKTALFGFGGEKGTEGTDGYFFFRIKKFEEPKWKPIHSAKTAALESNYPSTPTAECYEALEPYVRKHRPDVTVTITDGAPDSPTSTEKIVKKLKKHTRMVAFGIGDDARTAIFMENRLKGFGYHRVFSVDSVDKIPPKLVDLMAPTRR